MSEPTVGGSDEPGVAGSLRGGFPPEPSVVCRLSSACAAELAEIDRDCNRPPWSLTLFEQEFSHEYSTTLGLRSGGRIAAFLVYHSLYDEAHILNFGVRRDSRRLGYGRCLLTSALSEMAQSGCRSVILEARRSNLVAIGLYSSLGFQEVAMRKAYYSDDREDGVMLKLDLTGFLALPVCSGTKA